MRHSKHALLLFGAGGVLGLAVVSTGLSGLGRIASLTMAAGLVLLPIAFVTDWWSYRPWRMPKPKPRAKSPKRKATAARRSRRKPR
jgi:hypothetical protein